MRILFTGQRGFLGRELIPYFENQGHDVVTSQIDYSSESDVNQFLRFERTYKDFDYILHAAIRGGRRIRKDTAKDFYNNIRMFEILAKTGIPMITFCSGAAYGRQGEINNSPESVVGKRIPTDYYGFSKYFIAQRARQLDHVYVLRFFNVFGPTSQKDMFTSANIRNYLDRKKIVVFKDKYMDFFGIDDTKKVLDFYLKGAKQLPKDINLVYNTTQTLCDVAHMINNLSDHKVPIDVLEYGKDNAYCGSGEILNTLNLKLDGLQYELRNVYNYMSN
tara:strand:- start:213 stop:1040 length:828 start_codon:yes stop_codon:yes gene_type:complete